MKIENYNITTGMGKINPSRNPLTFLTIEEFDELNNIGYTGKNNKGIITSRDKYLNSLGKGKFSINQTKTDNGNFQEEFIITRVITDPIISKEELLIMTLKDILDCSQRRNRGCNEQKYLLNDLERIEQITKRGIDIIKSSKDEYTQYDIDKINLKEFNEAIDNI